MTKAINIARILVDRNYKTITGDLLPNVSGITEGVNFISVVFVDGQKIRIECFDTE